mgnify:CR=1 FL=1
MTTVAVIGCTHAGTFATTSILAEHPDWTVHVFERNGTLSFLSCGIALWVGDHVSDPKKMFYSSPAALAEAGATMHMRTDVTSVDLDARTLTYRALDEAGDPAEQTLAFDKLVVTTGSRSSRRFPASTARMCCCARTGITPSPSRKRRKPPSRQW